MSYGANMTELSRLTANFVDRILRGAKPANLPVQQPTKFDLLGRVEMWRGGFRLNISVAASFVLRCLSSSTMTPFPHPAHRTGRAELPHPALGQDFTPSPTARRVQAQLDVRVRSTRRGARVDKSRPCVA